MNYKTEHQKIWFVSDFHARHHKDFILDNRGYSGMSVGDVYEKMIQTWNERVGPADIVFNLGDFVLGAGELSYDYATDLISRLNCFHHYFLFGNHNAGVKQIYNEQNQIVGVPLINKRVLPLKHRDYNFTFLGNIAEITVDDQHIVLSHYPFARWNHMESGSWNIHGHTHGTYSCLPKQIDVGWEVFGGPVEFNEIKNKLT
jgi:calcineurin-like phosphoesterase family protein